MTNFDFGVGVNNSTANQILATIYNKLRTQMFKGQHEVVGPGGINVSVKWNVEETPVLKFSPPTKKDAENRVEAYLSEQNDIPKEVQQNRNEYVSSLANAMVTSCFELSLPKVKLSASTMEGIVEWKETLGISVLIQLQVENGTLIIKPLRANAKGSSKEIEWAVNEVLLPAVLELVRSMLPPVTIPSIELPVVSLTPPLPLITKGNAVGLMNQIQHGIPTPAIDYNWPESLFFILLKPTLIADVANKILAGVNRQFGIPSGEFDWALGKLSYEASATISNLRLEPSSIPTEFVFNANLNGIAKCVAEPLPIIGIFPSFGVNYKIEPIGGAVRGKVGVKIEGNKVVVTTINVEPIGLAITPTGSFIEWVISAVTAPLLQIITNGFVPILTTFLEGISINILDVPDVSIPIDEQTIIVKPQTLTLGSHLGAVAVKGGISVELVSNNKPVYQNETT